MAQVKYVIIFKYGLMKLSEVAVYLQLSLRKTGGTNLEILVKLYT